MNALDIHTEVAKVLASCPAAGLANRVSFVGNLRFLYHIMRASESLLIVASKVSQGALREYYKSHLEEERGHDEWLYEDLRNAGEAVFPCPDSATMLAGAQYYYLFHVNPCALLGYMMLLEGFPMPMEAVEALEALHGPALCRTLRHHALHDPQHIADLYNAIDALPEPQKLVVLEVALFSAHKFSQAVTGGHYGH